MCMSCVAMLLVCLFMLHSLVFHKDLCTTDREVSCCQRRHVKPTSSSLCFSYFVFAEEEETSQEAQYQCVSLT